MNLVVQKTIRATAERLFEAWTEPAHLRQWWGPADVRCPEAEIDLRVGGGYRIANEYPDGTTVWIVGEFETIRPPHELIYSWQLEPVSETVERVTVRFDAQDGATEVTVIHERIADAAARESHENGWEACLAGLDEYLSA